MIRDELITYDTDSRDAYGNQPIIDTQEIVRCRDCKHATELVDDEGLPIGGLEDWFSCHGNLVTSWDYYNDEPKSNPVEPDGFCAWGERRSE